MNCEKFRKDRCNMERCSKFYTCPIHWSDKEEIEYPNGMKAEDYGTEDV